MPPPTGTRSFSSSVARSPGVSSSRVTRWSTAEFSSYGAVSSERPEIPCSCGEGCQNSSPFGIECLSRRGHSDIIIPMERPTFSLSQDDAVAWLGRQPPGSLDLVVTDPPYESLEKHRAVGTTTRLKHSKSSSNDWFAIFPNARFDELFAGIYRALRRDSHFYLFCDHETMFVVKPLAEAAGFKFWKPLVWDKCSLGMGYHYRARYEFVLFFEKGKRKLRNLGIPDVLAIPRVRNGYPTEKPLELASILIDQSSEEGALVADPFCGSGAFGVAATRLGRSFIGNDLGAPAIELSRKRLLETGAVERTDVSTLVWTPPGAQLSLM